MIAIWLTFLLVAIPAVVMEAVAADDGPPWHTMRLGFNVGYITDTAYYHTALARTAADGFTHQRVMGPFLTGLRPAPNATADWVAWVLGNHTQTLTLTLSDYPYAIPPDLLADPTKYLTVWPGQPGTAKLASEAKYTNRGPIAAWANGSLASYGAVLRGLHALLAVRGLANRVDFELGNEPNALGYFWGTAGEFAPIADAAHAALTGGGGGAAGPSRIACCAFATELAGYAMKNGSDNGFYNFARGAARRYMPTSQTKTPLSFHFYRHSANDANVNRSTFSNITAFYGEDALNGSVVTEWGLFTYNSPRATAAMSSPALVVELVHLLTFAYARSLAEVDAHCLMDNPRKGGHNCYIDRFGVPKQSYAYLARVARIVRGGFRVAKTNTSTAGVLTTVAGRSSGERIVCACGEDADGVNAVRAAFELPAEWGVVASSGFEYDGATIPANEWLIVQNEPPN